MVYSVIDHKVEDYAKWKPAFDKHETYYYFMVFD